MGSAGGAGPDGRGGGGPDGNGGFTGTAMP